LGATADEVGTADATAFAGFTRLEVDPWPCGMTGASTGLESADTNLTNPCPWASGGVCGDTDDAGEVEAEWEASGVSGGDEGYVRIDGLGITGASFDKGTLEANAGIEPPVLELILFPVLWWENGAGAG
jgi:hypothetical protein